MATEAVRRPVPGSYSEMFPGRFLKADLLKGRKVTLTIKAIFGEDLVSAEDEQKKAEWIVQFAERPLEWVMNKSNAFCLYRMFGGDPHSWVGHKITLFPQPGTWFGEKGEAIRVWGSPELAEDLPITLKFLRKKKYRNMTMHRVVEKAADASAQAPPVQPVTASARIMEAFGYLMWNETVQANWMAANKDLPEEDQYAKLRAELDK